MEHTTEPKPGREVARWRFSRETTQRSEAWVKAHRRMDALCDDVVPRAGKPDLRRLYRDYGEMVRECAADDLEGIPPHGHPETRRTAISLYARAPERRLVLDGGCGPNPVTSLAIARDRNNRVVAMDIGPGTAAVAKRFAERDRCELMLVVGDLEHPPFRDGVFDVVICDDTFEHLADPLRVLGEFRRIVRSTGEVFMTTPNRESLHLLWWKLKNFVRGIRLPERAYYMDRSHIREYTCGEFRHLVKNHFTVRELLPLGYGSDRLLRRLGSWILHLPGFRRFSYFIMARLQPGERVA